MELEGCSLEYAALMEQERITDALIEMLGVLRSYQDLDFSLGREYERDRSLQYLPRLCRSTLCIALQIRGSSRERRQ